MGASIEIFIDNSPLSHRFLEEIKEFICPKCDVINYNLDEPNDLAVFEDKRKAYGIKSIPTVIVNGKIVDVEKFKQAKLIDKDSKVK